MDFHDSLVTEALFTEVARKDWQDFIKKYQNEKPGVYYCQFTDYAESVDDKRFVGSLARSHEDKAPAAPGSYVYNSKSGMDYKVGPDEKTTYHDKQAKRRATPDLTLWTKPSHHDPIGIYTYPAELVIDSAGQMPYGKDMRFMRVLKAKSGIKRLQLQEMTDKEENLRILDKAGVFELLKLKEADDDRTPEMVWEHAIGKIKDDYMDWQVNTNQKVFFWLLQRQLGAVGLTFVTLNNESQTRRLRNLGYDMVEDRAKTKEEAIIYPNEPTQAFFVNRSAFDIVDVYEVNTIRHEGGKPKKGMGAYTIKGIEAKIAHAVADLLNDQVHRVHNGVYGGVEHDNTDSEETVFSWKNLFVTKKGRSMGADARYDTDNVGKGHVPIAVVFELKGEKGVVREVMTPQESVKDFAQRIVSTFRSQPDDPKWKHSKKSPDEGMQEWIKLLNYISGRLDSHAATETNYRPGHPLVHSVNLKELDKHATEVCERLSQEMNAVGWHWPVPKTWYDRVGAWYMSEHVHMTVNRVYGAEVDRNKVDVITNDPKNFASYDFQTEGFSRGLKTVPEDKIEPFTVLYQAWTGHAFPGHKPGWWDSLLNGLNFIYSKNLPNGNKFISQSRYPNFGGDRRDKLHHFLGTGPQNIKSAASSS
jgi:hypothetical protein